jgi:hypothetical protein
MTHFLRDLNVLKPGLVLLICLTARYMNPEKVQAQSAYNPYEPFSSEFRKYSTPGGFNPFDAMSNNRSQNNTFQSDLDQLFGGRETATGRSRDSGRYYNAFRKYDQDFDRLYRPNQDVDRLYNERKTSRESLYLKAFREKDPKKRSALMKDFNRRENLATLEEDETESNTQESSRDRSSAKPTPPPRSRLSPRSSSRERDPKSSSLSPSRSGGLLGSGSSSDRPSGSLVERSGLLSEEIRPSSPPRGYGSLRSREEEKKAASDYSNRNQFLPGLPTLRP